MNEFSAFAAKPNLRVKLGQLDGDLPNNNLPPKTASENVEKKW